MLTNCVVTSFMVVVLWVFAANPTASPTLTGRLIFLRSLLIKLKLCNTYHGLRIDIATGVVLVMNAASLPITSI